MVAVPKSGNAIKSPTRAAHARGGVLLWRFTNTMETYDLAAAAAWRLTNVNRSPQRLMIRRAQVRHIKALVGPPCTALLAIVLLKVHGNCRFVQMMLMM